MRFLFRHVTIWLFVTCDKIRYIFVCTLSVEFYNYR